MPLPDVASLSWRSCGFCLLFHLFYLLSVFAHILRFLRLPSFLPAGVGTVFCAADTLERFTAYLADDGETWIDLPFDTYVSMNCWGFTPEFFDNLEGIFVDFLSDLGDNPMKAECYLPSAVDTQRKMGVCDVKVYPTKSVWYGVTYAEDKARVKASIRSLIDAGEYPEKLWN